MSATLLGDMIFDAGLAIVAKYDSNLRHTLVYAVAPWCVDTEYDYGVLMPHVAPPRPEDYELARFSRERKHRFSRERKH